MHLKEPQDKIIETFFLAKIDIERCIKNGMDFTSILSSLESRPYRVGDFVIDGLIAPELWAKTYGEIKIDERAVEGKSVDEIKARNLMPASNFFNL